MASAMGVSPSYALMLISPSSYSLQLRQTFKDSVTFVVYRLIDLRRWPYLIEHTHGLSHEVIDQLAASLAALSGISLDTLLRVHREQAVQRHRQGLGVSRIF